MSSEYLAHNATGPIQQGGPEPPFQNLSIYRRLKSVPMATGMIRAKLHELIREASRRNLLRKGWLDVRISITRRERGLIIMAGDIKHGDILCHLPAASQAAKLAYVFVPTESEICQSIGEQGSFPCVFILYHQDYGQLYKICFDGVVELFQILGWTEDYDY